MLIIIHSIISIRRFAYFFAAPRASSYNINSSY